MGALSIYDANDGGQRQCKVDVNNVPNVVPVTQFGGHGPPPPRPKREKKRRPMPPPPPPPKVVPNVVNVNIRDEDDAPTPTPSNEMVEIRLDEDSDVDSQRESRPFHRIGEALRNWEERRSISPRSPHLNRRFQINTSTPYR